MTASIQRWLSEPLSADVSAALSRLAQTPDVTAIAVMPDVHLAKEVCVGVALASPLTLFPQAVGGDIGCGIAALGFNADVSLLDDARRAAMVMRGLYQTVPQIRRHAQVARSLWPDELAPDQLSQDGLRRLAERDGLVQFATLGRGNHFLELQADEQGGLWAMVHSGSRALGPAIRDQHLRTARRQGGLYGIAADSETGRAYLNDMQWALRYAAASRQAMLDAIATVVQQVFGAEPQPSSTLACHHNFVRCESYAGAQHWVHRKGAIPAAADEPGIIAGSMGAPSYHVSGRGCEQALCSSSHGAGRVMSRSEARRHIGMRDLDRQMRGVWFDQRRAAQLRDEAPGAYKDIDSVMRAQRPLTRITRKLRPLLSYKGV